MAEPETVCGPCKRGHHGHDRWTEKADQAGMGREGYDAGCPNAVAHGMPCRCLVQVAPQPSPRCPSCGQMLRRDSS